MIDKDPNNSEEFEEVYTKVIDSMYDTLKDNKDIIKYYKINKARNAIVFEPHSHFFDSYSRETKIPLEDAITVVAILESFREQYPIEITKDDYNKWYVIKVDKIKYRKYIIQKVLK